MPLRKSSEGGVMNNTIRHLPGRDFEVVYDRDNPRPGKIEVLRPDGAWETLPDYEESHPQHKQV